MKYSKGADSMETTTGKGTKPGSWNGAGAHEGESGGREGGQMGSGGGRERSFLFSRFLFSSTTLYGSSSTTLPFILLVSDFIVPFFPLLFSLLPFNPLSLSSLHPPAQSLPEFTTFWSSHLTLFLTPAKGAEVEAFGSMQTSFLVL